MSSVEVTATIQRLQDFQTRYSYSDSCTAAGRWIRDRFQALGLETTLFPFTHNGYTINNVIAEKPGTGRPDEIYIICGHYDSITNQPWTDAPGADDNGSGTAAVLEAARVMAQVPFEATIRFIAFGGEEQGLIGSRRYIEQHVVPLDEDVRGVVNLDMIAYVHPSYPEWDANWYADIPVSGALGDFVQQCVLDYTTCVPYLTVDSEPTYGSDHYWFASYGYPAVFDIDAQFPSAPDWDPYYHTINDRLSTLNAPYATEMARGAVAAIATLAVPVAATQVIEPSIVDQPIPLAVGPNPFQSWTAFDVGSATVEVRITDAAGRSVDRLTVRGRLLWSGRDASGGELPAGVYFYTVQAGKQQASGRLVRVR
jgi:Zn-dependent M28 family amino/carboxypeptidase